MTESEPLSDGPPVPPAVVVVGVLLGVYVGGFVALASCGGFGGAYFGDVGYVTGWAPDWVRFAYWPLSQLQLWSGIGCAQFIGTPF